MRDTIITPAGEAVRGQDKKKFYVTYGRNVLSAQLLEVSLLY